MDCVNHIVEVVKKSSTTGLNKAQRYDNGKGFQYLDLNSVLGIFFKKLSGLQKYQHFLFEAQLILMVFVLNLILKTQAAIFSP